MVSAIDAAASTISGSSTKRNCGTPKSNSAWKVLSPTRNPPATAYSPTFTHEVRERVTWMPSIIKTQPPYVDRLAPPMSMRWVGPNSVTSWPKSLCQTSSSGKPSRAKVPQPSRRPAPTGARQERVRRSVPAGRLSRDSAIEMAPAAKTPARPKRMNQCAGLASGPASRPRSMCRLMSQYMPNSATSRASRSSCSGRAPQIGKSATWAIRVDSSRRDRSGWRRWRVTYHARPPSRTPKTRLACTIWISSAPPAGRSSTVLRSP